MKYFEKNKESKTLARIEKFLKEPQLQSLNNFVDIEVTPILEEVLEERVILFKDKINWKLPGGGAFDPHQDFEAWEDFPPRKFIAEQHTKGILKNTNGRLDQNLVESFEWQSILCGNRDLVIFDSFVPHRSDKNLTDNPRRVFYFTYNLLSDGDYYNAYFDKKRSEFPPDFERTDRTNINTNSKYNLANPIK